MSKRIVKSPSNEGLDLLTSTTSSLILSNASGFNQIGGGPVKITDSTPSTSTSTGAFVVTGGMGIGGTLSTNSLSANTFELTPQAADPIAPTVGMMQYADGTVRTEGLWQYKTTGWSIAGQAGLTGIQGSTGVGIQGVTGIMGIDGVTGIQGVTGIMGINGISGVTGIQGSTGVVGLGVSSGLILIWRNDDTLACGEETSYGQLAYTFTAADSQKLYTTIKLPNGYTSGKITLKGKIYSPTGSGNILIQAVSTLINSASTNLSDTSKQRTSLNATQAIAAANKEYLISWDITDTNGQISSSVVANDTIIVYLTRGTDTNTDLAYVMPSTMEVIVG